MTQEEAAEFFGVSVGTINNWVHSVCVPREVAHVLRIQTWSRRRVPARLAA